MSQRTAAVNKIMERKCSAIIRAGDEEVARRAMRAAVDGGFRLIEFTLTTPGAIDLIKEFAANRDLLVGAGTVLAEVDAEAAVKAGARFLVSPVLDPIVIRKAHELDAAIIPGTFTATEMQSAHLAGADFVKLFPGPANLPSYVASILGPLPHLRIYPTNAVTLENTAAVLKAGAVGVGYTTSLFRPKWLAVGDFAAVQNHASEIIAAVASLD